MRLPLLIVTLSLFLTAPFSAAQTSSVPIKVMAQAKLPLFYRDLTGFNTEQHGALNFPEVAPDYRFAGKTSVIPLLIHEVPLALRSYPLVFLPGPNGAAPTLAAMVGVGGEHNRFVGSDGQWRVDTYIPAWVRRYPFLSVKADGQDTVVLAFDPQAEWLHKSGGDVLMKDGKPTPRMERIIAFQNEFEAFAQRTQSAVKALADAGLLEQGSLKNQPPGSPSTAATEVKGFLIINERKLRALSDAALLAVHKADAMGLAYAQLFSMANLSQLLVEPAATLEAKNLH